MIIYHENEYASVKDACSANQIPAWKIYDWCRKNHKNHQQAFDALSSGAWVPHHRAPTVTYIYEGIAYDTFTAACTAAGTTSGNAHAWALKHKTDNQGALDAISSGVLRSRPRPDTYTYRGRNYHTLQAVCRAAGVTSSTLYRYCKKHGTTVQEELNDLALEILSA